MRNEIKRMFGVSLLASGLLLGCASFDCEVDSAVGRHFGEAQRENANLMIAHPDAGLGAPAPTGLDPVSAELAQKNYEYSRTRENQSEQVQSLVVPLN